MGDSFGILIVDDTRVSARALEAQLQPAGYEVSIARDGAEALGQVDAGKVDLVLLDLGLPDRDGLSVLKSLRSAPEGRRLPVVVISGETARSRRLAALRLGADDFFEKPADPELLLARIHRLAELSRGDRALRAENEKLEALSITDVLTQVQNRRFFQDRLVSEFRRAQRYDDPLALILIDLDHFKEVNDRYGHQVGDQVLRDVAGCLKHAVRETDLLARYGGEEFAVLLPKTHLAGSLTVAERIWSDLGRLHAGPDHALRVTASLGVSGFPNRSVLNAEQLVQTADDALYRAKREGRNKICLFQQAALFGPGSRSKVS